ncbi:MAG: LemA family protein [Vicinamibacteria bacterium]
MSKGLIGCAVVLAILLVSGGALFLWGTGVYNNLVSLDESVTAAWSQVEIAYQRRADLIPNLVNTVQGAADFERETLTEVIEARARATQIQITPDDLSDPQALARYQQAQDELSGALSRLLVTIERYPELKASQNFIQLQDELAGTENRISVERRRFNETAQTYNTARRRFPATVIAGWLGFEEAAYFEAAQGADQAPEVEFDFKEQ